MPSLDPKIWGPHYWFFLHTLALSYPHHPNSITKKNYYELIQNLPQFMPIEEIGKDFEKLLTDYPVTAYLDSREALIKWMHFIHNKINEKLEKPKITLNEFYSKYYEEYKPTEIKFKNYYKWKEKVLYILILLGASGLIVYLYNK
jgi:hypothetical protein